MLLPQGSWAAPGAGAGNSTPRGLPHPTRRWSNHNEIAGVLASSPRPSAHSREVFHWDGLTCLYMPQQPTHRGCCCTIWLCKEVQTLEDTIAWKKYCPGQLINGFWALLGSVLVRNTLKCGLLALFTAILGERKHFSTHHPISR